MWIKRHFRYFLLALVFIYLFSIYLIINMITQTARYSDKSSRRAVGDIPENFNENKPAIKPPTMLTRYRPDKTRAGTTVAIAENEACYVSGSCNKYMGHFTEVSTNVLVYSVYYDHRYIKNYLRMIAMATKEIQHFPNEFECVFSVDGGQLATSITLYEMCENHNRKYGGYIMSCEVPPGQVPCRVNVARKNQNGHVEFPVIHPGKSHAVKYGVCLPPIFGNVSSTRLVEFIELSRILGADHFHFYVYADSSTGDVKKANNSVSFMPILDYYKSQGLVTYESWALPVHPTKAVWYYGQSLAINDCLYKHIGRAQWLLFQDVDEILIPRGNLTTWDSLVKSLWRTNTAGLKISSAFFPPEKNTNDYKMLSMEVLDRTLMTSKVRTKCLVKPELIFEEGIHHISRPLDGFTDSIVPVDAAILHHYRNCTSDYKMKCSGREKDMTALRYFAQLKRRMEEVTRETAKNISKEQHQ